MNPVNGKPAGTQLTPEQAAHLNKLHAAEKEKADAALAAIQDDVAQNPEALQERLLELDKSKDKSIGAWSTNDIAKYVREVNPRLVEALISPEDPLSKDEYQSRIEHEIAKTLYKRNITHHTDPEKAESVYYALRHAQEAKNLRQQGKIEEADKRELAARRRWEASHAVTSATEKTFKYVGKGSFGSVKAVVPGEAGPIVMKKSLLPGAAQSSKDDFIEETQRLESLNHPGIIRLAPMQKSKQQLLSAERADKIKKLERFREKNTLTAQINHKILDFLEAALTSPPSPANCDAAFNEIEQLWESTGFNHNNVNGLSSNEKEFIDNSLSLVSGFLNTAKDEQVIALLQKSKQLFEAALVKQPEPDPVEQTADQSILSDDPQLDQLLSDESELFTRQPKNTAYLEAGGVPWVVLIKGKKDDNVKIQGVVTDAGKLEDSDDETLLEEIKDTITDISFDIYDDDYLKGMSARINLIWTNRNFSSEAIKNLLSHIDKSLESDVASEASLQYLNTLKALFATPKTEPVWKPAGGPLPMKDIQNMTWQLFDVLDYLHKKNIVHLDIKSDNVLIQPDGTVKVIDFGLSKPIDEFKDNPDSAGSPLYMAPEIINQFYKKAEYPQVCSEAVDVFSAGCLLHQLATGQYYCDVPTGNNFRERLFQLMDQTVNQTDTLQQKMQERIDKRYSDNPEKATQLKDLLVKMLEPQPEKRISMQDALKHPFFQ